jgi:protein tyrosine/serine phosphatase
MKVVLFVSIFFLALFFVMTEKTESKKEDLPNFFKVNENLYRGGQPTEEGVKQLAKLGIKTIISFRDGEKGVNRERKFAEENGIRFINPHLSNWFAAKDGKIEKILDAIRDPQNQPVFIHCRRGADRTGTVVAVYRMKYDGWTDKEANREAKKFGLGWWQVFMKDFIHDYYRDNIMKK